MLYEPLSEWRRWASWLRAVVGIVYALRLGELGARRDWNALDLVHLFDPQTLGGSFERDFATNRECQRYYLTIALQRQFLKWSGLVSVIRWEGDQLSLSLALGGREAVHMHRASMQ